MKFLVTVFTVILIFGACSKQDELHNDNNFVTIEQAIQIAKENLNETKAIGNEIIQRSDDFTTLSTITKNDVTGTPALYIVNYRSEGEDYFNIISADSRLDYIQAFGEGQIEQEDIVEGLNVWMQEKILVIQQIRERNLTIEQVLDGVIQARIKKDDDNDNTNCCPECPNYPECLYDFDNPNPVGCGADIECNDDGTGTYDPCDDISQYISVGPLMSTEWGQACDYNANCPIMGCTHLCAVGANRALTGCVATAMSQIIRFHEHPAGYDYANMLDDYVQFRDDGNIPTPIEINAVATLMENAGNEVNMFYACNVSLAWTCGDVPNAMTGFFNYNQTSNCTTLNPHTHLIIRTEIDNNRPLLFRGSDNRGGHAWVCDGYRLITKCFSYTYNGQLLAGYATYRYYWMNWGWNGDINGWFDYSTWGNMFNTNQEVIHHIIP